MCYNWSGMKIKLKNTQENTWEKDMSEEIK